MKKFIFFLSSFVFLILASTLPVQAQNGLDEVIKEVPAYESQSNKEYNSQFLSMKIGDIIGLVLSFVGVLFLILIIYGGISWMTASGNDQKVEKAKTIIINATIGLLVVLSAYAITSFIGNQFVN